MTDDRLTGAALRAHSKAKGPFWEGQARQMLAWAADLIDAADKMAVAPQPAPPRGPVAWALMYDGNHWWISAKKETVINSARIGWLVGR